MDVSPAEAFFAEHDYAFAIPASSSSAHPLRHQPWTIRRLLVDIGWKSEKRGRNSSLIEREDLLRCEHKYLYEIARYREEGRNIFCLDETWVTAGHTVSKVWADKTVKSSHDAYLRGLTTGIKQPSGKGQRLIATHVVSEDGFVDGCLNVFLAKKTGDYHKEMDGNRFDTWFISVVHRPPPRRVSVEDNASYHSRHVEKIPSLSWRRAEIQDWGSKAIPCHAAMTKKQLLDTVATVKTKFIKYRVDAAAECAGFIVLRHSPYRCYCNSIELILTQIKNGVAAMNTRFKTKDVHNNFPC
ncbi:uncharacterized protein LOC142570723 [Dermacentor variabilis]|uniref:uncharacterized protein LOC142570723 n=1 Tax=Dermacentor variabilis TaxID=34621 RepID=UPI003F5CB716